MNLKFTSLFIVLLFSASFAQGFIVSRCDLGPNLNCEEFYYEFHDSNVSLLLIVEMNQEYNDLRFEMPNCILLDRINYGNMINISFVCVPEKSDYIYSPPAGEDSNRFSYTKEFNIFDGDKFISHGLIYDPFAVPPESFRLSLILNGYFRLYRFFIILSLIIVAYLIMLRIVKNKKMKSS